MSLKHAILGFLSLRPMTGYELKKSFDDSAQHFWNANQSQIYRTLAELDEQGLVRKEVVQREDRLDMKIYYLSPAGHDELHRWLAAPLPLQETREPLLIQLFFANPLSDEEVMRLLQEHAASAQEALAVLVEMYRGAVAKQDQASTDARAFLLRMSTLEYAIARARACLGWLEDLIRRVESDEYAPRDISELVGEQK